MKMNIEETLDALRPLASSHSTASGASVGFLMADATRALGGLLAASNALTMLLTEGLVDSEPVVIGEEVHTLYRLTDAIPPTVH